jgi:4-hydroxybenzoate polyprenyltransferase
MTATKIRLQLYLELIRFNRPIGTLLLLWPTLWALWIAAEGIPDPKLLIIFCLGTFLMRSAGCVINDFADRHLDAHVTRTAHRPLAKGHVSEKEAKLLFAGLSLAAFMLVLFTNLLTIKLSFIALLLAASYPFMKRFTHLPQVVLGAAFSFGIPMAFAAQTNTLPHQLWLLYGAAVIWTIAYDTFYAMIDREDDLKIGIKSTAILFGDDDRLITGVLQLTAILLMVLTGVQFELGYWYFISVIGAAALFVYQQSLIRHRDHDRCFQAFLNNNWVGAIVFLGILTDYSLKG